MLAVGYLVAGYCTAGSYLLRPDGISAPAIEGASIMAVFGAMFAFVTGLAALAVVRLVGWRGLIVPAVLLILAVSRCSYLIGVPRRRLHHRENSEDELIRDVRMEQVAH